MIKTGDIVSRKSRPGSLMIGEPASAKWMFYSGYFLVIATCKKYSDTHRKNIEVCLIMNDSGSTSWIDKQSLKLVVELKNEE